VTLTATITYKKLSYTTEIVRVVTLKLDCLGYIFVADSMGLVSVNLTQLA